MTLIQSIAFIAIIFLLLALTLTFSKIRIAFITPRILKYFQKALPHLSQTEREALDAGDVWWENDLFCGNPDWNKLLAIPTLKLTDEEDAFLNQQVEVLCAMLNDWTIEHMEGSLPTTVWDYIKKERFFGLIIEKEFGGHGFSALAHSHIISKIASRSVSAAVTVMVPNTLGTGEFIHHYGTPEQKHYYLPRLASGEEISAFALTSPEAGSDASGIPDTGIVCKGEYQGQEVLGIRLNWDKRYITLAPVATLLGLAFKMYDPEHLLGEKKDIGITLCLVPTNSKGVEIGQRHLPLGLAFLNGPTRGKDVFLPLDFIIGGIDMRGKGWRMMMECLGEGRGISLPALTTGIAKLCYRMTGAYAQLRKQFHVSIGHFDGVAASLGRMGGLTYLCEATRFLTLSGVMSGIKPALAAAITKYHVTEMGRVIINDAMDIHAGRGIQLGPRNYLGHIYQAIPICITVEGANILTRNLIIFGQGAIRCHPYIRDEIEAAMEQDYKVRIQRFDRLLLQHTGYVIHHIASVIIYGLTGGIFIKAPRDKVLTKYFRQLTRMSAALAVTSDIVLAVLGGQLKRKEGISARLGDVLSHLYLASAVIKYFYDNQQPHEDRPFLCWSLEQCLYNIQVAFDELFNNFKPRWLAWTLSYMIFPWGGSYRPPKDTLQRTIANRMMKTSGQRDRLTAYCYIGKGAQDPAGRMEEALKASENVEGIHMKLNALIAQNKLPHHISLEQQAIMAEEMGVLSPDELRLLNDFIRLQKDAVRVDEF